ncbi:hypothetical protein FOZ60_005887 [Perkinsus olseni]|uniref:Uncharacterized protein n=1 Tax=Perkinsus olseni TaxID=32597 RepID=A0A7J6NQ43_PEROL|nr:hypothetical protein FOZ60_005887 [Perkinsus olseni]
MKISSILPYFCATAVSVRGSLRGGAQGSPIPPLEGGLIGPGRWPKACVAEAAGVEVEVTLEKEPRLSGFVSSNPFKGITLEDEDYANCENLFQTLHEKLYAKSLDYRKRILAKNMLTFINYANEMAKKPF